MNAVHHETVAALSPCVGPGVSEVERAFVLVASDASEDAFEMGTSLALHDKARAAASLRSE